MNETEEFDCSVDGDRALIELFIIFVKLVTQQKFLFNFVERKLIKNNKTRGSFFGRKK